MIAVFIAAIERHGARDLRGVGVTQWPHVELAFAIAGGRDHRVVA